jgi:hypothetical protein
LPLGGPHQAGLRFPRPPKSRYKGGFPLHFEQNLIQLLGYPDKVLHPFWGMAEYGTRVELNPAVEPDVVADAHQLPFRDGEFDAVILDPPYSDEEAERLYGTPPLRASQGIMEAAGIEPEKGSLRPARDAATSRGFDLTAPAMHAAGDSGKTSRDIFRRATSRPLASR